MKIAAAGDNGPKMAVGDENTSSNAGRTKESSRGKSSKSIPQLKLPKGFAAVPVSLDPPALRLNKLDEAELPKLQSRVDNLRYRGRLHQDSPALVDLAHVHVRRIALCRLAYGGQGFPGADAHFDCGSSYARMGLWSQALSHAKKSLHVHDRVAPGGAAQVDEAAVAADRLDEAHALGDARLEARGLERGRGREPRRARARVSKRCQSADRKRTFSAYILTY